MLSNFTKTLFNDCFLFEKTWVFYFAQQSGVFDLTTNWLLLQLIIIFNIYNYKSISNFSSHTFFSPDYRSIHTKHEDRCCVQIIFISAFSDNLLWIKSAALIYIYFIFGWIHIDHLFVFTSCFFLSVTLFVSPMIINAVINWRNNQLVPKINIEIFM